VATHFINGCLGALCKTGRECRPPGQYYLWRKGFHRWFGICVAKSAPVDEALTVPRVLAKYSRAMWRAIIRGRRADTERLVEAARLEIWEHITFWDDVYYAILGMENELAW